MEGRETRRRGFENDIVGSCTVCDSGYVFKIFVDEDFALVQNLKSRTFAR